MSFAVQNNDNNNTINNIAYYAYPQQLMHQQWLNNASNVPSVNAWTVPTNNNIFINNFNPGYYNNIHHQQNIYHQQLDAKKASESSVNKNNDKKAKEVNQKKRD